MEIEVYINNVKEVFLVDSNIPKHIALSNVRNLIKKRFKRKEKHTVWFTNIKTQVNS